MLYGPPGTGKTTTILAVAKQLYPKTSEFAAKVLEVGAVSCLLVGVEVCHYFLSVMITNAPEMPVL